MSVDKMLQEKKDTISHYEYVEWLEAELVIGLKMNKDLIAELEAKSKDAVPLTMTCTDNLFMEQDNAGSYAADLTVGRTYAIGEYRKDSKEFVIIDDKGDPHSFDFKTEDGFDVRGFFTFTYKETDGQE
jgi:hypothetical protein